MHTPGPWMPGHMTDPGAKCKCRFILSETCMGSVAIISERLTDETGCNDCPPENEAIANAHLIAAAPDLYDALLSVMTAHGPGTLASEAMYSQAVAALKKARGE